MRTLSVTLNDFFNIYPTLTPLQKKILQYLQWFAKKFRCVFPCLQKIANAIRCSIRTVSNATRLFENLGWVYKKRRGYCSNIYFINEEIIALDLKDESIFLRENLPIDCHVLKESSSVFIDSTVVDEDQLIQKKKEKRPIPHFLKKSDLQESQRQTLANDFHDRPIILAIEEAENYERKGNVILNLGGYLWKAAQRYANKTLNDTLEKKRYHYGSYDNDGAYDRYNRGRKRSYI